MLPEGAQGWAGAAPTAPSETWAPLAVKSSGFPGKGKQQQHPYGAVGAFICLFVCLKWVGGVGGRVNDRFRQRISSEAGHVLLLRSCDS